MAVAVKGTYLLMAGGGAILLWSGLRGHKWTTTLRSVLSGQPIPKGQELAIGSSSAAFSSGSSGVPAGPPPTTALGGTALKNKAIGRILAAPYGWSTGQEWADLDWIWTEESGWNDQAKNPQSGAYGIPQALPASKMGTLALPPVNSASAQISWGLKYIKGRYGSPSRAKAFHLANGWY